MYLSIYLYIYIYIERERDAYVIGRGGVEAPPPLELGFGAVAEGRFESMLVRES